MTKLTTKEMLISLTEGGKVRISSWDKDCYVHFVDGNIVDQNREQEGIKVSDAFDYELYEEPVKPVRRYLYDYVGESEDVCRTVCYYKNDEDFKKENPFATKFQKRENDWTEL